MIFKSRLKEIAVDVDVRANELKRVLAGKVVEGAKGRVPVATGALRDAIHMDDTEESIGVFVVAGDTKAWYGHIVEHGGANVGPRPFLIPATMEVRREMDGIAKEVFTDL